MINTDRLINNFMKYVKISSPTKYEKEFALFLQKELEDLGFEVYFDDTTDKTGSNIGNLIATLNATTTSSPILFSCHMDTVSPGIDIKPILENGIIKSDGSTILAADDKAGISAIIEAVRVLKEQNIPHGKIELAFSVFEEGGLKGAKALDYSVYESKHAFVLDSSGEPGQIIIQGPAQDKINFKVIGKPAHAGVCPEEGISAIMVASDAISNMKLLRIDSQTTANIGKIEGGSVTNIVASKVIVTTEARSLDNSKLENQTSHMIQCFKDASEKYGAKLEYEHNKMYQAFSVDENSEIVKDAFKACENLGIKAFTSSSGGGSDTNIINTKGKIAVNLGIGERKPHSLDEHIYVKDLENVAKIVLELIKIYSNK